MTLLLINPNTSRATTEAMRSLAQEAAPPDVTIRAQTAPFGAPLITAPEALRESGKAVLALLENLPAQGHSGVIIAAFGDPGLGAARRLLSIPVTGIAEAGMAEAAAGARRFAVVTTTPDLVDAIAASAASYGHAGRFLGTELTEGDATSLTNDPERLRHALLQACRRALARYDAEAIVIGGGPLAMAARAIAGELAVPIIEPVPAAVRLAVSRARQEVS